MWGIRELIRNINERKDFYSDIKLTIRTENYEFREKEIYEIRSKKGFVCRLR